MTRKTVSKIMLTLLVTSLLALASNPNLVKASPETISSTLDIKPDTLNLDSKGRWITAYIELPEGYDVGNIDLTSIRLGKEVIHSGNLVTNGGFEDELDGWTTSGGGTGYYSHAVVNDGTEHPDALEYKRWASGADGGSVGTGQDLDILVSDYDSLYLELDVKVSTAATVSFLLQCSFATRIQMATFGTGITISFLLTTTNTMGEQTLAMWIGMSGITTFPRTLQM
jgi:hypothetical protein